MKMRWRNLFILSTFIVLYICVTWIKKQVSCCDETGKNCITCSKFYLPCALKPNQAHCYVNTSEEKGDLRTFTEAPVSFAGKNKNAPVNQEVLVDKTVHATVVSKDSIMLAISVGNRRGYTQFTASVIKQYGETPSQDIRLFLNAGTNIGKVDLMKWYGIDTKAFPVVEGITTNNELQQIMKYFLGTSYQYALVISDDMIFSKRWREFTLNNINKTDGILSTYHSAVMHGFDKDCAKKEGDLCLGKQIGKFGVVVTKSKAMVLLELINSGKIAGGINWEMISNHTKSRLFFPTQSFSMMIGQTKQNSGDNCGVNEVPYRFNRCEFPQWIQDGIEFYFDRCTSPQEEYIPGSSIINANKEKRFWTRPVVSYSLYGDDDAYIKTGQVNARRVFSVYPGWKIWIYTDYTIPEDAMKNLCALDVRFVNMSGTNITTKMSWRFLVASEPVKMYAVRDADSYLLPRGKAAVDEWIQSGRKFHVMRDNPNHSKQPMNGGMWGGLHDAIPEMRELLLSRRYTNGYGEDMKFLRQVIWGKAKESVWTHDSHSIHKFGEDHPFPTELKNPRDFVGRVVIFRKKPRA